MILNLHKYLLNEGIFDTEKAEIDSMTDIEASLGEFLTTVNKWMDPVINNIIHTGSRLSLILNPKNSFLTLSGPTLRLLHEYIRNNNIKNLEFSTEGTGTYPAFSFNTSTKREGITSQDFFKNLQITNKKGTIGIRQENVNDELILDNVELEAQGMSIELANLKCRSKNTKFLVRDMLQIYINNYNTKGLTGMSQDLVDLLKNSDINTLSLTYAYTIKDTSSPISKAFRSLFRRGSKYSSSNRAYEIDEAEVLKYLGAPELLGCNRYLIQVGKYSVDLTQKGSTWYLKKSSD